MNIAPVTQSRVVIVGLIRLHVKMVRTEIQVLRDNSLSNHEVQFREVLGECHILSKGPIGGDVMLMVRDAKPTTNDVAQCCGLGSLQHQIKMPQYPKFQPPI